MKKNMMLINIGLLVAVVLLAVFPLIFVKNAEFGGADNTAREAINEIAPSYQPWAKPLITLPGPETESLMFAVQAAIGAGVLGYAIGYYKGRSGKRDSSQ